MTVLDVFQDRLAFGGVGDSGMGNYHGRDGFDRMTTDLLAAPFTQWTGRRYQY